MTATRTRKTTKPTTCTLVTRPVCCCELLPRDLDHCDCPGHERWGHCKHSTGLRDLRARGQI